MVTIHKFTVDIAKITTIKLPDLAEVLSFGVQNGVTVIWVLLDTQDQTINRHFTTIGTGWDDRSKDLQRHRFIGTATENGFIWHCFEIFK